MTRNKAKRFLQAALGTIMCVRWCRKHMNLWRECACECEHLPNEQMLLPYPLEDFDAATALRAEVLLV